MERKRRKGEEKRSYARWDVKEIAKLIEINGILSSNYVRSNDNLIKASNELGRSLDSCIGVFHNYIKNDKYKVLSRDLVNKIDDMKLNIRDNKKDDIQQAIDLLKHNGYRIMQPIIEYKEL